MKDNRRDFLKFTGLAGLGFATGMVKGFANETEKDPVWTQYEKFDDQQFNMSGYAAPKINTVRVGFIGLGQRGPTHLTNMTKMDGVSIMALCDIREEKVLEAQKLIENSSHKPTL